MDGIVTGSSTAAADTGAEPSVKRVKLEAETTVEDATIPLTGQKHGDDRGAGRGDPDVVMTQDAQDAPRSGGEDEKHGHHAHQVAGSGSHSPRSAPPPALAWSSTNCIAVGLPTRISIIPISVPRLVSHIVLQEKPHRLAFNARGDALVAIFARSRRVCLWTRSNGSLNQWALREQWSQIEGRVLAVQWLSEGRQWMTGARSDDKAGSNQRRIVRAPARGPQAASTSDNLLVLLIVTDRGQITLAQGSTLPDSGPFQIRQHRLYVASHQRLKDVAVGLVPNESTLLLAYTLRLSATAGTAQASFGEDTFGIFFDDAEDTAGPSEQRAAPFLDGQDKIELVELRIELAALDQQPIMAWRPLSPIYTGTTEDPSAPFARDVRLLVWVDEGITDSKDGAGLQLLAFFNEHSKTGTDLRAWQVKREEIAKLSDAFAKLEGAVQSATVDTEEDWMAGMPRSQHIRDCLVIALATQSRPARLPFFAVRVQNSEADHITCRALKIDSLEFVSESANGPASSNAGFDHNALVAISPHATRVVGIKNGYLRIRKLGDDINNEYVGEKYAVAIQQQDDVSDLDVGADLAGLTAAGTVLGLTDNPKPHLAMRLTSIASKQSTSTAQRKRSRLLLELVQCFRTLREAEQNSSGAVLEGVNFHFRSRWIVVSHLEWILSLLEEAARQAHLLVSTESVSTPPARFDLSDGKEDKATPPYDTAGADLISLLALTEPRMLLVGIIKKLVKFANWIDGVTDSQKASREMLQKLLLPLDGAGSAPQQKNSAEAILLSSDMSKQRSHVEAALDSLQLCRTRVHEALLQSPIDLSNTGRSMKDYKPPADGRRSNATHEGAAASLAPEAQEPWWLTPGASSGERSSLAQALLKPGCIRDMLSLFCPASQWQMPPLGSDGGVYGDGVSNTWALPRDVFTKAPLASGNNSQPGRGEPDGHRSLRIFRCLSCDAATQATHVAQHVRCVCGALSWWATTAAATKSVPLRSPR